MGHNHQPEDSTGKAIGIGLILNGCFTVAEFIVGFMIGSLALVADATHNLTDTLTLSISFFANKIAKKQANERKTYGYGRITILAALFNSLIMIMVSGFIIYEAIDRMQNPRHVEGGIVAIMAFIGLLINGGVAYILSKHRSDLNMKSAFIDMLFDAISSLGAVISGIVILATGINGIDTAIGLVIAGLLIYNALKILFESLHILLESTPKDADITFIKEALLKNELIKHVDDIHIWTIRSGYVALTCHIAIDEKNISHSRQIVESSKAMLLNDYGISHATIEVEFERNISEASHETH